MYKLIDIFAGAGGLSLGFDMTKKFDIVAFVENNDNAANTYLTNHPGIERYKDIRNVDFSNILDKVGKVDIVIGGPPCQGFSNANRQKRKIINGNNELVKSYVNAIKSLKPDAFVMENVKTIASNKHSFYLTKNDKRHIIEDLNLNVYKKECILYDRMDYSEKLYEFISNVKKIDNFLISNEQFNLLRIFGKKEESIKKFLNKKANIKKLDELNRLLMVSDMYPEWYNGVINKINKSLEIIIQGIINEDDIKNMMLLVDIQSLFRGIDELQKEGVIYNIDFDSVNGQIIGILDTYTVIEYIEASFNFLGYKFKGEVLNAANYGVPQKRERFIMIGIKNDIIKNNDIKMPEKIIDSEEQYYTVSMAIDDLVNKEPSRGSMEYHFRKANKIKINNLYEHVILNSNIIYNHVCTDSRSNAKKRFAHIEQGMNFHSLPKELKSTYMNPQRTQNTIYKRLNPNLPSDTVVNVRKSMWIHPELDRAISAREAARLQSFPDNYIFKGTKDSVYQQIGNAVPPILGRAVAESLINMLGEDNIETLESIYSKYKK